MSSFFFYGCGPGVTSLRSGDLGGHPPHGQGHGGFSEPGGETSDWTDPAEDTRQELEIHPGGGGKGGCEILDD